MVEEHGRGRELGNVEEQVWGLGQDVALGQDGEQGHGSVVEVQEVEWREVLQRSLDIQTLSQLHNWIRSRYRNHRSQGQLHHQCQVQLRDLQVPLLYSSVHRGGTDDRGCSVEIQKPQSGQGTKR